MRAPMSSSFKDPRIVAATVIVTALLVGLTGRAGGDRTHDRGIMRWKQTVGLVRWRRNGLKKSEFFVRWCRIGLVTSDWYVG